MPETKEPGSAPAEDQEDSIHSQDTIASKATLHQHKGTPTSKPVESQVKYIHGPRKFWMLTALFLSSFLAQMEMTIVSTALVAITNDLQDFENSTWFINSYLVVWSGFLVLWAQFSYSTDAKPRIILRAFQGLGGAGAHNLAMVIITEAVEPKVFPKYVSLMAVVASIAMAAGPLIGGAIASRTSWRWVFILNVPGGLIALVLAAIGMPNGFPDLHRVQNESFGFEIASLKTLDMIGAALFLCTSLLLVTALQEVNTLYSWNSGLVIAFLVIAAVSLMAFTFWERTISIRNLKVLPLLSWDFAKRRTVGLFASSFLMGAPFIASIATIPQRLQVVNGFTPLDAGIRFLAFVVAMPLGAIFSSVLMTRSKLPPFSGFVLGALVQLAGVICFSIVPIEPSLMTAPASSLGFEALFAFGTGISNGVVNVVVPGIVSERRLVAPCIGASTQFRFLGGAVGLGIVTCVLNSYVQPRLAGILSQELLVEVLQSAEVIRTLHPSLQVAVLNVYADGFTLQWRTLTALVGAQVLAALLVI